MVVAGQKVHSLVAASRRQLVVLMSHQWPGSCLHAITTKDSVNQQCIIRMVPHKTTTVISQQIMHSLLKCYRLNLCIMTAKHMTMNGWSSYAAQCDHIYRQCRIMYCHYCCCCRSHYYPRLINTNSTASFIPRCPLNYSLTNCLYTIHSVAVYYFHIQLGI